MVNSEYALKYIYEKKTKSLRLPGYWIAQRQRDEERRGENENELESRGFIDVRVANGPRVLEWTMDALWVI